MFNTIKQVSICLVDEIIAAMVDRGAHIMVTTNDPTSIAYSGGKWFICVYMCGVCLEAAELSLSRVIDTIQGRTVTMIG